MLPRAFLDEMSSIPQSMQAAEAAEAKALASGSFKFTKRPKTEGEKAEKKTTARPAATLGGANAAAGVRNATLLSFAGDEDEADE